MMIVNAAKEHIPGLLRLLDQVGQVHYLGRPDLFRDDCLKYDEAALETLLSDPQRPIFVAVEGDGVLGYCFCVHKPVKNSSVLQDRNTLYIDDLCVEERCRGQHIGKRLYAHAEAYARNCGCDDITLNVWAFNESALRFYESLGMKPQRIFMETVL